MTHSAGSHLSAALDHAGRIGIARAAMLTGASLVLWAAASQVIRVAVPAGWFAPGPALFMFGLALPNAFLSVWLVRRMVGAAHVLRGTMLACAVAMLADGVALVWAPALYGADTVNVTAGAAWLLFGVACILLAALRDHATP